MDPTDGTRLLRDVVLGVEPPEESDELAAQRANLQAEVDAMRSTAGDTGKIALTAESESYTRHDGGDFVADGFEKGNVVEVTGFRKAGKQWAVHLAPGGDADRADALDKPRYGGRHETSACEPSGRR